MIIIMVMTIVDDPSDYEIELKSVDNDSKAPCLKCRSRVFLPVLSARKRSQCLTKVRMSGSPLSPKFPTVALQGSKSSASVHSGGCIETPGTCAFNVHSLLTSVQCLEYFQIGIFFFCYKGNIDIIIKNSLRAPPWGQLCVLFVFDLICKTKSF